MINVRVENGNISEITDTQENARICINTCPNSNNNETIQGRTINQPSDDTRMMYQVFLEDIRNIKKQIWLLVYYILALQAALIEFCDIIIKVSGKYYPHFKQL